VNIVFANDNIEKPYYSEAMISENDTLSETLNAWFKKLYQKPYVVTLVDILSTGVDICKKYKQFFCAE